MDGNGSLFGTLSGNSREILGKFSVDLPKKHGRGGQSALRFARLRMEKRHNYVRKVAETAVQFFISVDKVNVAGIVLAGSADFKTELSQSDMFDGRLQAAILAVVDVSYGEPSCLFVSALLICLADINHVAPMHWHQHAMLTSPVFVSSSRSCTAIFQQCLLLGTICFTARRFPLSSTKWLSCHPGPQHDFMAGTSLHHIHR